MYKFKKGDRVRPTVPGTGTVKHPNGDRRGEVGVVSHYYGGGVTPIVYVEFADGFIAAFNEAHLEAAE